MTSRTLIEAVAVTAELCGRVFSPEAARMFVEDLSGFEETAVLAALRRCRREVRGALTVQDVVSRLEDGRPGVEEAFSMLPKGESDSAVWTQEMAVAFGVCLPLLEEGDRVAARMAFKESYQSLVAKARDEAVPVVWTATLGHDPSGRESVLRAAADKGRISLEYAAEMCPAIGAPDRLSPAIAAALAPLKLTIQ